MTVYHLCLAWNWPPDADFVALFDAACRSRGLSLLQAVPGNIAHLVHLLNDGQLAFCVLFDRASDSDARFNALIQWASEHAAYCINPPEHAQRTWDKAAMHTALIGAGLHTPYTIVLPPPCRAAHPPAG